MVALLTRDGEGVSYLHQMGIDLHPGLTETEREQVLEASTRPTPPYAASDVVALAALTEMVADASGRITLVADLEPRRSMVAFLCPDGRGVALTFTGATIVASETSSGEVVALIADAIADATVAAVNWSVARWAGAQRRVALRQSGDGIDVTGSDPVLVEAARHSRTAADLVTTLLTW